MKCCTDLYYQVTSPKELSVQQSQPIRKLSASKPSSKDKIIGPRLPGFDEESEEETEEDQRLRMEEEREKERWERKRDIKDYKKTKEMVMEELVPKKTGRDAQLDKKKSQAEFRKSKDEGMDTELTDKQLFESEGPSFSKMLQVMKCKRNVTLMSFQKQRSRAEAKEFERSEEYQRRWGEYQRKEAERLAPFLEMVRSGGVSSLAKGPP